MLFDYLGDKPGRHILLATTCYDKPAAAYAFSLARVRAAVDTPISILMIVGNCHVDDGRNLAVHIFLNETTCTDLVFIDADVSFEPQSIAKLITTRPHDIVGGVYPHRSKNSMSVPVRTLPGATQASDGSIEVSALPTGFLRLPRAILEGLSKGVEHYNVSDYRNVPLLFRRTIDANGDRVGGDIGFCLSARRAGYPSYALYEERLGHTGNLLNTGSMASEIRRIAGVGLEHVISRIQDGDFSLRHFEEAWDAWGNVWAAGVDTLGVATLMARKADKPILEMGCGLTTLLMAAASKQTVYAVEHDGDFAEQVQKVATKCGIENIAIYVVPWVDGWYRIPLGVLPSEFSFALVDGPPLYMGSRRETFFDAFPDVQTVIVDDAERVPVPDSYLVRHHDGRLKVVEKCR